MTASLLVTGLLKVEVGEAQRFSLKWAVAACLLMLVAALVTGAFPLRAGARSVGGDDWPDLWPDMHSGQQYVRLLDAVLDGRAPSSS